MKRAAALLALLLLLTGCADGAASQPTELVPPFWLAEDTSTGNRLYLLGSMHVGESNTVYPDYVMDAYEQSTKILVEVDTKAEDTEKSKGAEYLLCPEGTDARQYFGEDYDRAADFFGSKGIYRRSYDRYIPYFWASVVSTTAAAECGLYSEYGTESVFISLAHADGKEVVQIESYEEQYRMMSEIPMSVQLYSVLSCIGEDNYAEQLGSTRELYNAWATFDEAALGALNEDIYKDVPQELEADYGIFMEKMYYSRQRKMAQAAMDALAAPAAPAAPESGSTSFMLVGAAHFFIEEDILTLLEKDGYRISEIRPEEGKEAA
ncbi:MAG: TraB/GumN family protein [Oscillospiraceae bacterium]